MSDSIAQVKDTVRAILRAGFDSVPSATPNSDRVHLEVWRNHSRRKAVGVEMDHDTQVNFWVVRPLGLPPVLPATVERVDKQPNGRGWISADGKGANSNLSAYDEFRTRPIARLEVKSVKDARLILDHLSM